MPVLWWLRRLKLFFLKSILFSCDIHFILKSYPFYFHVISILFSCHAHFIFMSYSFYFHVIVILKKFKKSLELKNYFISKTKCIWHRLNFFRLEPFEPRPCHMHFKMKWNGRGSKCSSRKKFNRCHMHFVFESIWNDFVWASWAMTDVMFIFFSSRYEIIF